MQKFEIAVVGGGLVGRFAAACLAPFANVALIEPNQSAPLQEIPHLRVSALTAHSLRLLEQAEVLPQLDEMRLGEILGMELSDEGEHLSLRASEISQLRLGYVVENEHLSAALCRRLQALDYALFKTHARRLERLAQGWRVHLEGEEPIEVKLLLIAEGSGSALRRQLQVKVELMDYQQTAWVCHVETEKPHGALAYQRFLPTGTLAFLPLFKPNWSSIVWALPSSVQFDFEALQRAFPDLGKLKLISAVGQFPLFAQNAETYVGKDFALLGDAAHTVHPLAGQGVNLGFQDVEALTAVLKAKEPLRAYQARVKRHNEWYSMGFSVLNRLYQEEHGAVKTLRQLGWKGLSHLTWIKKALMQQMS